MASGDFLSDRSSCDSPSTTVKKVWNRCTKFGLHGRELQLNLNWRRNWMTCFSLQDSKCMAFVVPRNHRLWTTLKILDTCRSAVNSYSEAGLRSIQQGSGSSGGPELWGAKTVWIGMLHRVAYVTIGVISAVEYRAWIDCKYVFRNLIGSFASWLVRAWFMLGSDQSPYTIWDLEVF